MFERFITETRNTRKASRRTYVVDDGVEIEGNLRVHGAVRVDGFAAGRIEAITVVVGSGGEVHGVVVADEAIIEGVSSAEIYAKRIVLRPGSMVTGEIYHEELLIEPHALFEGKSRRMRGPQEIAPQKVEMVDEEATPMTLQVFDRVA